MTEPTPTTSNEAGTEFTPLGVNEMFPAAQPARGRLSVAARAARDEADLKRREAYQTLLAGYAERGMELGDLTRRYKYQSDELRYERNAHDNTRTTLQTERKESGLALKVLAGLARMMPDDEFDTRSTQDWAGLTIVFTNVHASFEPFTGSDGKPVLRVTPVDTARKPVTFDLDDNGVPPFTVLLIKAHLGLDDKAPLTKRAAAELRKEPPPSATSPAGVDGLLGLLDQVMSGPGCGNPDCPACGTNSPFKVIGGMPPYTA